MGKIHFFTKEQSLIIDQIAQSDYFRSNFYFTGGTALSCMYLHHRESEDLDFFSEKKLDTEYLLSFMEQLAIQHGFTFTSQLKEIVYIFLLTFPNKTTLKVDFGYYPYKVVEKGMLYKKFQVNSMVDIAVNKLTTVNQRTKVRDFVDLYYLLQKYSIWDLIEGVRVKFHMEYEPLLLATDLLIVDTFTVLPRMILPLTLEELKIFFHKQATELGKKSVI